MSRDDAAYALREPAERLGAEYELDALEQLLDATGGYLYFTQELGKTAWDLAPERTITAADAAAAVTCGTDRLDPGFFRSRWERATKAERRMLFAMAADGAGPSPTAEVARRMTLQPSSLGSVPSCTH